MASPRCSSSSPLIVDIPPRVLDEFCGCMDCLTDRDWERFVSHVLDDETSVRRFMMKRQAAGSATRELLWSWGQKLTNVQDLEKVLQKLELFRALEILRQNSLVSSSGLEMGLGRSSEAKSPVNCTDVTKKGADCAACSLPSPPPPPPEMLKSLQDGPALSLEEQVLRRPQQEISVTAMSLCQHWTPQELNDITDGFSADKKIFSGQFADLYLGRLADKVYAVKRIKEVNGEPASRLDSFFQTEAEISFRCDHPNLLLLQGFCLEAGHRCLVTHFMKNGSLDAALQEAPPRVLSWERRLEVASGLLRAVRHLHEANLLHGNIKSSNVFLDDSFSPKLGHSGARFCPNTSANYTQIRTEELQRYQPYLPNTYLRRGQLTAQTDIFSAGVVLAEILTGFRPHDKSRNPTYLKDLIVQEMEACVESSSDKLERPEHLCAERIAQKYRDTQPGVPPGAAAFYLARAACACLTNKKVTILEVLAMTERAQSECSACARDAAGQPSSTNVPEESYFVPSSVRCHSTGKATPPSQPCSFPCLSRETPPRTPCQLGGASNYLLSPNGEWSHVGTAPHPLQPTSRRPTDLQLNSPSESDDPSWGIEVNTVKMRLMQNISLYQQDKVDSSVLFDS